MRHQIEMVLFRCGDFLVNNCARWNIVVFPIVSTDARFAREKASVMTLLDDDHCDFHLLLEVETVFGFARILQCSQFDILNFGELALRHTVAEIQNAVGKAITLFLVIVKLLQYNVFKVLDHFLTRIL